MLEFLRQLTTGKDNTTHDLGRWSWIVSVASILGASGMNWWHNAVIDIAQLAQALATVAGAHGLALWAKKDTEPGA